MDKRDPQDNLDRLLDGLMSQEERAQFLQTADSAEVETASNLQAEIDDSLRRMIGGFSIDSAEVEKQFLTSVDHPEPQATQQDPLPSPDQPPSPSPLPNPGPSRRQWLSLALASCLLIGLGVGVWSQLDRPSVEPVDSIRQVAMVYHEKISDGFRPYYVCDDPVRFAETFQCKVGQRLALATMPAERKMLGLSYLGGISRETVAMLSEVEGKPVIVFVDRQDKPGLEEALQCDDPDLNVFVERKHGLVFLEVTPHASAKIIEYFQVAQ